MNAEAPSSQLSIFRPSLRNLRKKFLMYKQAISLVWLLLLSSLFAGCGGELDNSDRYSNEDHIHNALIANTDSESQCSPYTEALIDRATFLNRTVMNSTAFDQCIQQRMAADYVPCGDPFMGSGYSDSTRRAKAKEALSAANHMEYSCSYSTAAHMAASAHYQGWGSRDTHYVDLADDWAEWFGDWSWYSDIQPLDWRASNVIHEYMHTHDYAHLPDAECPAGYHGGTNSAPYIYGGCVYDIIDESYTRCSMFSAGSEELSLVDSWPPTNNCEVVPDLLHRVAFRSYSGNYLRAVNGGGSILDAAALGHGPWETFYLIDLDGDRLMSGDYVHIKSTRGEFLRASGGGAHANLTDPDTTTRGRFIITVVGGGEVRRGSEVRLRAYDGRYVVAESGGGGAVNANRWSAREWETFTIESPRRARVVRLRADSTNQYVQVQDSKMYVNAPLNGDEDAAFWLLDHNGGALEDGDEVSLETLRSNHFISTCQGGNGHVRGNANFMSTCSHYEIEKLDGGGIEIEDGDAIALRSAQNRYLTGVPYYPGFSYQLWNYSTWIGPWQRFTLELAQNSRWDIH